MAFEIKQHDLRPRYRVQLTQSNPSTGVQEPVNLNAAESVKFLMRGPFSITKPATFVDKDAGIVEYHWVEGDTDMVGSYNIEFEITWEGDEPQTFPSKGYFKAKIYDDLD